MKMVSTHFSLQLVSPQLLASLSKRTTNVRPTYWCGSTHRCRRYVLNVHLLLYFQCVPTLIFDADEFMVCLRLHQWTRMDEDSRKRCK